MNRTNVEQFQHRIDFHAVSLRRRDPFRGVLIPEQPINHRLRSHDPVRVYVNGLLVTAWGQTLFLPMF